MNKITSIAPGRICLFGEHQDYLNLPVIAAAINLHIELNAEKNNSAYFNILMPDINQQRRIAIDDPFDNLEKEDFLGAVLRVARRYGCVPKQGADITIRSAIPINAGASSSSAMTVAWANLLFHLYGADREITPEILGYVAYEAEVKEHNSPGGMMDQYAIASGGVVLIESDGRFSVKTLRPDIGGLVLGDSCVPKKTLEVLSRIKESVLSAAAVLQSQLSNFQLKNVFPADLADLSPRIPEKWRPFFIAAVKNHFYTHQALAEFRKPNPDFHQLGNLMNLHHYELKNHLSISVPRIDEMIHAALDEGALGAKINGSGGGGTIAILAPGRQQAVLDALAAIGAKGYAVAVDPGAHISQLAV